MILKLGWFVSLVSILAAGCAVAWATHTKVIQNQSEEVRVIAQDAFSNKEWELSKEKNLEILSEDPEDPDGWFYLGLSQHYLGEFDAARRSFQNSKNFGHEPSIIHYNLACGYALQGYDKGVFEHIQISKDLGFPVEAFAQNDEDFREYINRPEFKLIIGD
jgi:hypothetical protein